MDNGKKLFIALCEDAVTQYNMGVREATLISNIAYLAETQGLPMVNALDFADTMSKTLKTLKKGNQPINTLTVAQQFLKTMSKT